MTRPAQSPAPRAAEPPPPPAAATALPPALAPEPPAEAPAPVQPRFSVTDQGEPKFEGLPAVSADGRVIAVPLASAFSGFSYWSHIAFVEVDTGDLQHARRVYGGGDGSEYAQAADETNRELVSGGFVALPEIAHWFGSSVERATDATAEVVVVPRDEVDVETESPRHGDLQDGPRTLDLHIADGTRFEWTGTISNQPTRFRRIPSNCRMSFFSGGATFWISESTDLAVAQLFWGSGSDECGPWRWLFLRPGAPAVAFEETAIRSWR